MKASALLLMFVGLGLFVGCGPQAVEKVATTEKTYVPLELRTALDGPAGGAKYAQIQHASLPAMYANFRSVLTDRGLVKWDERFDCRFFSMLYIGVAQADYAVQAWHLPGKATGLALAEVWYKPAGGNSGHSIVAAMTDKGLVFIEPQNGRQVFLSEAERKSIMLAKW